MSTAKSQAQLQTYVEQEVAAISPLKQRSELLKGQVDALVVNSAETVEEAKTLRKDIIAHEKEVNEMRMDVTRQLNDVTKTLINAERDVLAPAAEAKINLGRKVVGYEEELARIRLIEIKRVNRVIELLVDHVNVSQLRSLKNLTAYEEQFEARVKALSETDGKISEVITTIGEVRYNISEQRDTIRRLDEESNEARRNELERQAERARAEKTARATQRSEPEAPKTGSRVRMTFEIVRPELVPRDLCTPNDALIRAYINDNNLEHLDGVLIKRERVL